MSRKTAVLWLDDEIWRKREEAMRRRGDEAHQRTIAQTHHHNQRWSSSALPWVKELVLQNVKNLFKRVLVSCR